MLRHFLFFSTDTLHFLGSANSSTSSEKSQKLQKTLCNTATPATKGRIDPSASCEYRLSLLPTYEPTHFEMILQKREGTSSFFYFFSVSLTCKVCISMVFAPCRDYRSFIGETAVNCRAKQRAERLLCSDLNLSSGNAVPLSRTRASTPPPPPPHL